MKMKKLETHGDWWQKLSNKMVAIILIIGMLLLTLGVFKTLGSNADQTPNPQKITIKAPTGGEIEDD